MTYAPAWTNQNASRRVTAAEHWIKLVDVQELISAVNRRRRLTCQSDRNFTISDEVSHSPLTALRSELVGLLTPPTGGLGGSPPSPEAMAWLWPVSGGDENRIIVAVNPSAGQVGLMAELNGTDNWTDVTLDGSTWARAVHCNELRQAVEWISRGRWTLPIYFAGGLFSMLPDTPWTGEFIANNGTNELRTVGNIIPASGTNPVLGLTDVGVRASSSVQITADTNCTVDVYHCLREIDYTSDPPTWNEYDPSANGSWATPGGLGGADSTYLGAISLTANVAGTVTGQTVATALQSIVDGAEPNFLVRRNDTDSDSVYVSGKAVFEFDLDSPPN